MRSTIDRSAPGPVGRRTHGFPPREGVRDIIRHDDWAPWAPSRSLGDAARAVADEVYRDLTNVCTADRVLQVARRVLRQRPGQPCAGHAPLVAAVRETLMKDALHAGWKAGVTAVWAPDGISTVELARLEGPHDAELTRRQADAHGLPGAGPWVLRDPRVQVAVYRHRLTEGSPFEMYRVVNLLDLAQVFGELELPEPIRYDWERALTACGLRRCG
jgi:hypothetical protein